MFIDIHMHAVRIKSVTENPEGENFASPEELIQLMDRTGVDKGVLLPWVNPERKKQYSTNEDILEICGKYPDRFIPFCGLDPRAEDNTTKSNFSRQLVYYKDKGCKGVGELTANMPIGDPMVQNLFRHCEACEMPILFHIGPQIGDCYGLVDGLHLPGYEKALKKFKKLVFIGHSQPFWAEISGNIKMKDRNSYPKGKITPGGTVVRLLEKYPNLYADISANSGYNALTRDPDFGYGFMERFRDKLLFGTDICSPRNNFRHAEFLRETLKNGHISKKAFEKISWQNANKILKLNER